MTPYTVIPLKMISVAKSTGTSPLGMPSSCTRPPIRTAANAWCRAEGTPDISHTTSAPSPPVSCKTVRTTSSRVALMMTCAPMVRASSRRLGFTSDAMTFAAPAALADRDDLAGELVTDHERRLEAPLRPRVPVGDVQVGAAHARMSHGDEHLPGTGGRFRDGRDLQTRGAFLLDDRLHHTGKGKGETLKDSLTVERQVRIWIA